MIHRQLLPVLIQHRDRRRFRACARRSRNRQMRHFPLWRQLIRPHMGNIGHQQRLNALGGIHCRPAADGNQPVTVLFLIQCRPRDAILQIRIGMKRIEHGQTHSGSCEKDVFGSFARDEEGLGDAHFAQE